MRLEWIVDRRGDAGPIIAQGTRPTCLSCATSSAHHEVVGDPRCIEFLHHASRSQPDGFGAFASVRGVLGAVGQPPEAQWPYESAINDEDATPPAHLPGPFSRARLDISTDVRPSDLVELLQLGSLPVIGLETTPRFMLLRQAVLALPDTHLDLHAVVLVGAATYTGLANHGLTDGDTLLCIQNSWGTSWGSGGYGLIGPRAWLDMALLAAVVTAV